MAPHDEEDDPAVYRSGSSSKKKNGTNGHVVQDEEMHDGERVENAAEKEKDGEKPQAEAQGEAEKQSPTPAGGSGGSWHDVDERMTPESEKTLQGYSV